MIFITVGTHEQPFNRLLEYMDRFIDETKASEKIVCQSGYSTYVPRNFKNQKFINHDNMQKYINKARVIITHGGPSSFMPVLASGKTPIVVPRQKAYSEHVNDHQLEFCHKVEHEEHSIIMVKNYSEFKKALVQLSKQRTNKLAFVSHNSTFCNELENLMRSKSIL